MGHVAHTAAREYQKTGKLMVDESEPLAERDFLRR